MVLVHQVYIAGLGPASLSGHIRQTIAGTCTDTYSERESYAVVHEAVKHSTSEYTAQTASFQYKSGIIINRHCLYRYKIQNYKNVYL
jgi:hypothetical protein